MAKAYLKFDLTDQDERMEHMRCVKALDMSLALFDIHYDFTRKLKDMFDTMPEDSRPDDVYDEILRELAAIFEAHDINVDELSR
jgi:hypothetical protein